MNSDMIDNQNIVDRSYQKQIESFSRKDEEMRKIQQTWFNEDTVDYWRHRRMIIPLKPLFNYFKSAKWLTIGDGRFGLDSIRLKKIEPALDILPTDISVELLKEAKENNLISDYRCENAERLSFGDDTFDFAFCKESYHHFPRPYIALYEMIRVSKRGIIFIEPNERRDKKIPERILGVLRNSAKKILGKPILHPDTWHFEVSGNYVYMLSKNEAEKIGIGLQLPAIAFYFYNDYYEKGLEFEKATPDNKAFRRVKKMIAKDDMKCRMGLQTYQGIIAIFFKQPPDQQLRNDLKAAGFSIVDLPVNPYLKSTG